MNCIFRCTLLILVMFSNAVSAQSYWENTTQKNVNQNIEQFITPTSFRSITLNTDAFLSSIDDAPTEEELDVKNSSTTITIPMPDGSIEEFRIVEYSMMEPALAAQFPKIKTYKGIGLTNPLNSIRFDWTSFGFRAVLRTPRGMAYIEPFTKNNTKDYISFWRKDLEETEEFICQTAGEITEEELEQQGATSNYQKAGDCLFRSYRLAVAVTGEYSTFHGASTAGTSADVALIHSAVVTTINRVNDIYERDLGIRLILIANNASIYYFDGATDPYTNLNGVAMLTENQTNLYNNIGSANYDVGHVFSTGGGGVATLNSPCYDGASSSDERKARGVTGTSSPVGDAFDIDYVCHELGHQFGAHHTFNSSVGACGGGNRTDASAYETGSGSTIMAYAGICAPHNVQNSSDAYFHSESLREMSNFVTSSAGNACATLISTSNSAPTANAGLDYTIPPSTPFVLTGSSTDSNGDAVTYTWEQWDNDISTQPPIATSTNGPNFRTFLPTTQTSRYVPNLADVVSNTTPTYEVLASVSRNYEFRLSVRDNSTNAAGCTAEDNMSITVDGTSAPFLVTSPNTTGITWTEGGAETVTWNIGGTTSLPINCSHVNILISYDGGLTFPDTLASEVPNSGTANITVPSGTTTSTARVMVKGHDNIFYDLSDNDITIAAGSSGFALTVLTPIKSVCSPNSVSYTVNVDAIAGFSESVLLSVSSAPTNAMVSFSANPVAPGGSTVLTVSNINSVAIGTHTPTLNGSTVSSSNTLGFTVDVIAEPSIIVQNTPTNNETNISLMPTITWTAGTNVTGYDWEVSTNPTFATVLQSGSTITTSSTLTSALESNTDYFWRVRGTSDCGEGTWSSILRFTTIACLTLTNNTSTTIIQGVGGATTESIINIADAGTISDIEIRDITGTHTWVSDLTVSLKEPGGISKQLWVKDCGGADDFDISFDDNSANSNSGLPCTPLGQGGTYKPKDMLNIGGFNGFDVTGDWALSIFDDWNGDGGNLEKWTLFVCLTDYSAADALPVNFLSFEAKGEKEFIKLEWGVSEEMDNVGYEIERKSANNDFIAVGFVEGRNSSSLENELYQFEDYSAERGIIYQYRLRQIDESGRYAYSQVREAALLTDKPVVQIFPNPTKDFITIDIYSQDISTNSIIRLFDITGMKVFETSIKNSENIKVNQFSAGMYLVEIETDGFIDLRKLVIE